MAHFDRMAEWPLAIDRQLGTAIEPVVVLLRNREGRLGVARQQREEGLEPIREVRQLRRKLPQNRPELGAQPKDARR